MVAGTTEQARIRSVDLENMDVIDANAECPVSSATRRRNHDFIGGLIEGTPAIGGRAEDVVSRLRGGESLGLDDSRRRSQPTRRLLLGHFVSDELADGLDNHYVLDNAGRYEEAFRAELAVDEVLAAMAQLRRRAQKIGAVALVPFVALLAAHGFNHQVPLFLSSFAAFLFALPGIAGIPKMRGLALREARLEYAEYYFLFPLFLSITLLTSAGFFDSMQSVIQQGMAVLGRANVAFAQFIGCTFLSAILDVTWSPTSHRAGCTAWTSSVLHLFAMAQIAKLSWGCWTHIGCAQSVVAPRSSSATWMRATRRTVDFVTAPVIVKTLVA